MKNFLLDVAWWSLTFVLLSYIILLALGALLFVWNTPLYTKALSALDRVDLWRRSLFITKHHFKVKQ